MANALNNQHMLQLEDSGKRAQLIVKRGQEELLQARTSYTSELTQQLQLLKERAQAEDAASCHVIIWWRSTRGTSLWLSRWPSVAAVRYRPARRWRLGV